jgi:hypothetical protein
MEGCHEKVLLDVLPDGLRFRQPKQLAGARHNVKGFGNVVSAGA